MDIVLEPWYLCRKRTERYRTRLLIESEDNRVCREITWALPRATTNLVRAS